MNTATQSRTLPGQHADVVRPLGISFIVLAMMPLVILPLASIFIFGLSKGPVHFWDALMTPAALFSLKLSLMTSSVATACNVVFGLLAAYIMSKYRFKGGSALMIIISLPTAIPTAVAGFALLLVWGRSGLLGRFLEHTDYQIMFTTAAIILANIFVTFPLAFGVIKPALDNLDRSYEDASETMGATRWQTFRYVVLPSLRGAIVTGALLTFARSIGEFGSTIMVSGNLAMKTQTAPLYIFTKFNEGDIEGANALAAVLAIISFAIFSLILFTRSKLEQ
ncbi:MAG TPA: ABC transporter permease [Blastocatellia bacterium]|nr:ABC transporter permease [Blastocatellia bacterium]HMV87380.1 ABC transporter permease [Blastocatellia bacterium]HMX24934.1 ABC transporter permease [Blastocatellia bacterium]HMY74901.1 ABC transporter permease [Blastocatellia bacterium]HMZ19593.1 ABC transporter permease [Blastocatellia bacterium]